VQRRRFSKAISIGNVTVGGGAPVVVQSMTKTDTRDVSATISQIKELEEYGCQIIRVAVPDVEAAQALTAIKKGVALPLIADIHFDYRLALLAMSAGVDGLRLNPGNLHNPDHIRAVVSAARERGIPIRIGINAGSLPHRERRDPETAHKMVALALEQIKLLESLDYDLIKVSLKAFDVPTTVAAYEEIAPLIPYPLHLGITEAGTPRQGPVRGRPGYPPGRRDWRYYPRVSYRTTPGRSFCRL
jgi:(E)-4-hydroxy-3-methylbut-2-enyl-diphosphate synthase